VGDNADQLLEALRRGKVAFTVEDSAFLIFHVRQSTLQLNVPTEAPRYHLRVFVENGELVFLVADQEAPQHTVARHPWSVHLPIADALGALENLGAVPIEEFKARLAPSYQLVSVKDMGPLWLLVGMFDAELPVADAPFSNSRGTRLAAESTVDQMRIVSGDAFCSSKHEMGLVLQPDDVGNPAVRLLAYRVPGGTGAVVVKVLPAMLEYAAMGLLMLEAVRPVVRSRLHAPCASRRTAARRGRIVDSTKAPARVEASRRARLPLGPGLH
jgi:hypothetical protein